MFSKIFVGFFIILCNSNVLSKGIEITQYPDSSIERGSTQIISWTSPVKLDSVSIDLYQMSNFKKNLGRTNQQLNNFNWKVSGNAPLGDEYYIKITGKSDINGTAWANTPTFSIISNGTNAVVIVILIIGVILVCSGISICCKRNTSGPIIGNLNQPLPTQQIPVAQPTAATYPPPVSTYPPQVVVASQRQGYSGGSVAGAAVGGFAAGVVVDEIMHSGGHHHHHHHSNNDFGSGSFFGGGDSGGDSSYGFFSDDSGGGGDNSGGFF